MRRTFVLAFAALSLAAPSALAHDLPLTEESCTGDAPIVVECTTGDHTWFGVGHTMTCGFEAEFVGSVVSWFEYPGGFHAIRCTRYANGTLQGDQFGSGPGPALLSTVTHRCASFEPASFTPGGSGHWTCSITH